MIRVAQLKLNYRHTEDDLKTKLAKELRINVQEIESYKIVRRSIDARQLKSNQGQILFIYTVDVLVKNEKKCLAKNKNKNITSVTEKKYEFPVEGTHTLKHRPVIVGSGPAGLFCGLMLARAGYRPILVERGEDVDARTKTVDAFWTKGQLNTESNVQFGEGGAGTFSDGKLGTLVKDKTGRHKKVLEIFAEAGASPEILYVNKPHVGTDVLKDVVRNIRQEMISLGAEVLFNTKLNDLKIVDHTIQSVELVSEGKSRWLDTQVVILAPGHSARDTFEMLYRHHIPMTQKAFAIGVRMEHPQTMVNVSQYGIEKDDILPAADYKLTYETTKGRHVYTFCMCPGGYVVNASSEEGYTAVNGMSYHDRGSDNANSAVIVNVTPDDFESDHPLAGVAFQRKWEKACYGAAGNRPLIPVQLFKDFKEGRVSKDYEGVLPLHKGNNVFADLNTCLPDFVCESLVEGVEAFGRKIKGYDRGDALMSGIETRTSSPLRIQRDEQMQSEIRGLYPCGEGAGYAGGITSAAMDGIRVAEAVAALYAPFNK